jgi:hypothetical protein
MKYAATKPIDGPDRQNVIVTPRRILQHRVEGRSLIPAFGTTDALVLVGLDDQPTTLLRHPCQDQPLILGGLIVAADPEIDRRAAMDHALDQVRQSMAHVLDEWAKVSPETTGMGAFARSDWPSKTDRIGQNYIMRATTTGPWSTTVAGTRRLGSSYHIDCRLHSRIACQQVGALRRRAAATECCPVNLGGPKPCWQSLSTDIV